MINLYIVGAAFAVLAGVFIHGRVQAAKIRKQQEEIESVKREAAAVAQELENANTAKTLLKLTALCLASLLMSSCSQKVISVKTSGCSAFGLIYPSRKDTEETKRQVLNHNLTYEKICQKKEPK